MQSEISFILDGQIATIDFNGSYIKPTTTVLNFLRNLSIHKGAKEGCAEGDCGACTVVIGELDNNNKIIYKAIDSCLVFLPMLHGKHLITVENLKTQSGELHPVQTEMVEMYGSQCGYCTPGIIMSLFVLYKNHNNPSRDTIEDYLTGNLCRCTGYKPIVESAVKSCVHNGVDQFTSEEPKIVELLKSIPEESIKIETEKQKYFIPVNNLEAISLKNKYSEAILINGATDIALRVTKKHELLKEIIDISHVQELKEFSQNNSFVSIGSVISLNEIGTKIEKDFPALYNMLCVFGSRQIRNVATLGGNLGTASPIGDTLPVLMAYNTKIILQSVDGKREVNIDDFFTGYRKTLRKPNEIITSIVIPKIDNGVKVKSYKVSKRRDLDISTVSGGFRLEFDSNNNVKNIKLVYGGMAEMVKRAKIAEDFLIGKKWDRETVEQAMILIDKDFTPISDARAGAEMRKVSARNLLLKFWNETI